MTPEAAMTAKGTIKIPRVKQRIAATMLALTPSKMIYNSR